MEIITDWGMTIKTSLQSLNLSKVDSIALHHMAHPTADIYTVQQWHLNQGWRALGYNYWVGFDGKIYQGRGLKLGAGVENQNDHIISIGFQGDYHSNPIDMPDAQFNAGIDIIKYVKSKVPTIKKIDKHGAYMATSCAGQYFPLAEMKSLVKRNEYIKPTPVEVTPSIEDCTNEFLWRGIISNQPLWNEKAYADEDIKWLIIKSYPYILKNGGSVKNPLSIPNVSEALNILSKHSIVSNIQLWTDKASSDENIFWILLKLSDYIN